MTHPLTMAVENSIRQFVKTFTDRELYLHVLTETNYRLPLIRHQPPSEEELLEIIARMQRECAENQLQWKLGLLQQERMTKCTVSRSLSGLFYYKDSITGAEMSCEDYKKRYAEYATTTKVHYGDVQGGVASQDSDGASASSISMSIQQETPMLVNRELEMSGQQHKAIDPRCYVDNVLSAEAFLDEGGVCGYEEICLEIVSHDIQQLKRARK